MGLETLFIISTNVTLVECVIVLVVECGLGTIIC